jgi:hypothetical protein
MAMHTNGVNPPERLDPDAGRPARGKPKVTKAPGITKVRLPERRTAEQRRQQIELAAYRLASQRGFEPGHDVEDWLAAEAQIEFAENLSS